MRLLIRSARVMDPHSGHDGVADVAVAAGRVVGIGHIPDGFEANRSIDANGLWLLPGLVDLCARVREPGHEHSGMLASELRAAAAGGVTSLVCPPDTDPPLDEPGLVEMLISRANKLHGTRVLPLGALTQGLAGMELTELQGLAAAGCVGFGQADVPVVQTQVMLRAMQYAATFGHTLFLRPLDLHLSGGVAASGAVATRLGLSGVPVVAETIALATLIDLTRATGVRLHVCRVSSAAGVALLRRAKDEGLPITADVSVHNLHLTDVDIGHFDSRLRLSPPLRQAVDRAALRAALADGTIDALVSDHTPVSEDEKTLPFGEATPGASSVELLLPLALKWAQDDRVSLLHAVASVTSSAAHVLGFGATSMASGLGQIAVGGVADLCLLDPAASWGVEPRALMSQSKTTAFDFDLNGTLMPAKVRATWVAGQLVHEAKLAS